MQDPSNIVRTMWHGSPLSVFELLSLLSFARCGHKVELYAYSNLKVPSGIRLCDANAVLPESRVFSNTGGWWHGTFAAFSDIFRYKLLYEKGGIWADLDTLCLKSLRDLPDECVGWVDNSSVGIGIMKFPAGSRLCEEFYSSAIAAGEYRAFGAENIGPALVTRLLAEGRHACNPLPISAFYPIHLSEASKLFDPEEVAYCEERTKTSYSVHWWNNVLKGIGVQKEELPPMGSFLRLKAEEVFFGTSDLKASSTSANYNHESAHQQSEPERQIAEITEKLDEALREWNLVRNEYENLLASTSWRITHPLRLVAAQLPVGLRQHFRRTLKAATHWSTKRRFEWLRRHERF